MPMVGLHEHEEFEFGMGKLEACHFGLLLLALAPA